jgi:hypothetical protein
LGEKLATLFFPLMLNTNVPRPPFNVLTKPLAKKDALMLVPPVSGITIEKTRVTIGAVAEDGLHDEVTKQNTERLAVGGQDILKVVVALEQRLVPERRAGAGRCGVATATAGDRERHQQDRDGLYSYRSCHFALRCLLRFLAYSPMPLMQ